MKCRGDAGLAFATGDGIVALTTSNFTADMLFHMPDDGYSYELVRGELRKMTPSGFRHGVVVANLTVRLGSHVRSKGLGVVLGAETGFRIATEPDTVRAPDIAFVRAERLPASGSPEAFWAGAPDLAIEVLSPSDTVYRVDEKIAEWLGGGARLVWVVNPGGRVVHVHRPHGEVQTLTEHDVLDGEDVVPGFRCTIAEFLA